MSEKWPEWLSQNKEWLVQFSPTLSIQSIESIAKRGFRGGTAAILHYLYELWWPGQKWDNGEITANGLWMAVSLAHEKELETATVAERERIFDGVKSIGYNPEWTPGDVLERVGIVIRGEVDDE